MKKKLSFFILLFFCLISFVLNGQPRSGDSLSIKVNVTVNKLTNNIFQYFYSLKVSPSSKQPLVGYTIEIGIENDFDLDEIFEDSLLVRNWGYSKFSQFRIKPLDFAGAEVTWIPLDTLENDTSYNQPPINAIMPGDSIVFHLKTKSLPIIRRFWAQGWVKPYTEEEVDSLINIGINETELFKPWYSNALVGLTLSSYFPKSNLSYSDFVDTLISNVMQSWNLKWIKVMEIEHKYQELLENTKTALQQNNISVARTNLQNIINDVDIDSSSAITSEAYALLRYNTEYLLSKLPQPPSGLPVKLVNSNRTKLLGGSLQYYEGGWKNAADNGDGTFNVDTQLKTVSLRMNYEYGSQIKSNVTVGTDTIVFQTVNALVKLQDSQGNPIDTGNIQYYAGGWRNLGITVNGTAAKELLPVNYTFRMSYAFASNDKAQNLDTNSTVVFQTVNAAVQLKNSLGGLIDQGTVQYYSGGWRNFGITVNGITNKELLPNNYTFRMNYAFASNDKAQNIGTDPTVVFQTVNANVQLKNSQGSLMDQGTVQYYSGGWRNLGVTVNGIAEKELLPNNYTFRMSYAFASNDKAQNLDTNTTVVFKTVNTLVVLRNSLGNLITGEQGTVQYYSGGWRSLGTTITGTVNLELLPNNYTFRMTHAFISNDKAQNTGTNNTVRFSTVLCTVRVRDAQNQLINNAAVSYYSGGWRQLGNTANGEVTKELLPANLTFRVNYNGTQQDKTQNLSTSNIVEFIFGQ